MSFYSNLFAKRIGGAAFGGSNDIFKFEKIKRAKAKAKIDHPELELIDLGVGEPDKGADEEIVNVLYREALKIENRKYADNGIIEFQKAAIAYMEDIYKVYGLDYRKNVVHGIGSKSILSMIPLCVIDPEDIALVTIPGYPMVGTHTEYLGGKLYNLPLEEKNNYLPNLKNIPGEILKKAKILYLNYPNNPTGAVATKEFFQEVIEFAKKNEILVVHDAAYSAITFDDYKPLSFFTVEGGMDVGVEVHSLSKSFNMTGWRLAFIIGNEEIINAFKDIKDNSDSGQFRAVQFAGEYALNHTEITEDICNRYSKRMDKLIEVLNSVGFKAKKPKGSFYCYVKSPIGANNVVFKNAEEAADYLIRNALISVVPWDDVEAYLRFSVTFEGNNDEETLNEVKRRLEKLQLRF